MSTAHAKSLSDPKTFWANEARNLEWSKFPNTILETKPAYKDTPPQCRWFVDGELSASYNMVTRHVLAGWGVRTAIHWDSPVSGEKKSITYGELQEDMELFADVLRTLGVKAGDRVLIYMPMIPEAVVAMLACAHIGAVHVVVFGGFAPTECAKRIESAKPTVIITASCGIEGKKIIPYLPFIREAIEKSTHKPRYTLMHQRPAHHAVTEHSRHELNLSSLILSARRRSGPTTRPPLPRTVQIPGTNKTAEIGISLPATAPHYILHTSGTTGTPKGVTRPLSHLVGINLSCRELLRISTNDVLFCASDIGWVVGHAFIIFCPLLAGATTVLYEGKPIGTPDAGAFWRMIEEYKINSLYCAPSALRGIVRDDPELKLMKKYNIKSLRALFLAGERSEPALVERFQQLLPAVIDNWWSTESGSPMTGLIGNQVARPGSAGKPMPGWNIKVVSDTGRELGPGEQGNVVIGLPLPPTALSGLWGEDERYYTSYWKRFSGSWMDTGDVGILDLDGYLTIVARGDDVINVAAHRLGTAVIEGVVAAVDGIAEAFVVPAKDALKGQVPVAFVVLKTGASSDVKDRVRLAVRTEVGPIAAVKAVIEIPPEAVPRTRSGKVMRRAFRGVLEGVKAGPEVVKKEVWDRVIEAARAEGLLEERAKL
ncbi:propionyl-CoA synthetase [Pyronema omphalodes]|nr:propionyl-CoA synthetase [Pyronema omphalodes]